MTTSTRTLLRGLQPEPLASYLASLGVLRVCATQHDKPVRGCFAPLGFTLEGIDEPTLLTLLLEHYSPTPIVAPWNGGSGFAEGDDTVALDQIRRSGALRLARYSRTIRSVLQWPELPPRGLTVGQIELRTRTRSGELASGEPGKPGKERLELDRMRGELQEALGREPEARDKQLDELAGGHVKSIAKKLFTKIKTAIRQEGAKEAIMARARRELPDEVVAWLDAAYVLGPDDAIYPPVLGSGGNEGRLDYSNTFMNAVVEVLLGEPDRSRALLRSVLLDEPAAGLPRSAVGQFSPGTAGGFNMGAGFASGGTPNNPWRFVLLMEGVLCWAGSLTRRQGVSTTRLGSSPFTVEHVTSGHASASAADSARGELWTPIWERPASLANWKLSYLKVVRRSKCASRRAPPLGPRARASTSRRQSHHSASIEGSPRSFDTRSSKDAATRTLRYRPAGSKCDTVPR